MGVLEVARCVGGHMADSLGSRVLVTLLSVSSPLPQLGTYRTSRKQGDPLAASPNSQVLARYSFREQVSIPRHS